MDSGPCNARRVVRGNHDHALGWDEDPQCSEPYREMAATMQRYTATQLSAGAKSYLAGLPLTITRNFGTAKFMLCHAVPSDPLYAYVPEDDVNRWEDETVIAHHPDFLLVGHTHRQFVRQFGDTTIVNPGSVGQPKNGDSRASYAIWDSGIVELFSAPYDVQSVVKDLAACATGEVAQQLGNILLSGGNPKFAKFW